MNPVFACRNVPHESLGTIAESLQRAGLEYRYVDFFGDVAEPFDPTAASGMIVLGGPMNVDETERYPLLVREVDWVRDAVDCGLPLLGICLGSQILAKALGARVRPNPVKEIGWYGVSPTNAAADDPLFKDWGQRETVFQWHGDTFDLPAGAVHLAASEDCGHQAFRYGDVTYGIQFHVEVTAEMIEAWLDEPTNRREVESLDYIDPHQIRQATPGAMRQLEVVSRRMLDAFASMCRRRATGLSRTDH